MSSASTEVGVLRLVRGLATSAIVLGLSPAAHAQGCAMCKNAAEASGNPGVLNRAILVLLFPTLAIFAGIVYRAYKHR